MLNTLTCLRALISFPAISSNFICSAVIFAAAVFCFQVGNEARGATFLVTNTADSGAGSLRQAIADANAAAGDDTINVMVTGTVLLASDLPGVSDHLIVNGGDQTGFIIDGQNAHEGFDVFSPSVTVVANFNDLTVQNASGGGIKAFRSTLALTRVTVKNSTGTSGGGVSATETGLTIANCVIDNNTSTAPGGGGGGVYASNNSTQPVTITNTQITNNDGTGFGAKGGGVYFKGTGGGVNFSMTGSAVSGNTTVTGNFGEGGGLYFETVTRVAIAGSTVSDNTGTGIFSDTGEFLLEDVTIANNTGGAQGGGLYIGSAVSQAVLENCRVTGNTASDEGGGIYISNGDLALTNTIVENNSSGGHGGGIASRAFSGISGNSLTVTGSRIINNDVSGSGKHGGGLYFEGILVITGSVVAGNTLQSASFERGGGLFLELADGRIENSTVSGNTGSEGAGIYRYAGTLRISNATIADNAAATRGGGLFDPANAGGIVTTFRNCTITGNSAADSGGGIYSEIGQTTAFLRLANTIIADNTAPTGAEIFTPATADSFNTRGVNIIKGAVSGTITAVSGSNITGADPGLLPLMTYGGIVPTRALAASSNARNAGINGEALDAQSAPAALTTDARGSGFARFVGQVDIGAYEERLANAVLFVVTDSGGGAGDGICDASCTLSEAIAAANSNFTHDEIFFDSSPPSGAFSGATTITLSAALPKITRSLSIEGTGQNNLFISGSNAVQPFDIDSFGNPTVIINLSNLTVENGNATTGGGIHVQNSATLNAANITVKNSTAVNSGGGIAATSATLNLTGALIEGNTATNFGGGGISSQFASMTIINSRITNNQVAAAAGTGGGISMAGSVGSLLMTGSTVSGNSVPAAGNSYGGGLHLIGTTTTRIENSTVNSNSGQYGAGVLNATTLRMSNVTIAGNTGAEQAGGLMNLGGSALLRNCTIAGNSATLQGGGIYSSAGTVTIANTIVADNTAPPETGADIRNAVTLLGANIIEDSSGYTASGAGSEINDDPELGALADNGGLVETKFISSASIARNAGDNGEALDTQSFVPAAALTTDARGSGFPRFVGQVDIGAFELAGPTGAFVAVSGRVVTGKGAGIRNVYVSMTDSSGNTRTVLTGTFGYFRFNDVAVGDFYVFAVRSKRYTFSQPTQAHSIFEKMDEIVFTGEDQTNISDGKPE